MRYRRWRKIEFAEKGAFPNSAGILHLSALPEKRFSPDKHSSTTNSVWDRACCNLIFDAFRCLILNGYLVVSHEIDQKSGFLGLNKLFGPEFKIESSLPLINAEKNLDWLETQIVNSINIFIHADGVKHLKKNILKRQIALFLEKVLGTSEAGFTNPSKLFISKVIKNSKSDLYTFEIVEEKRMGVLKQEHVDVNFTEDPDVSPLNEIETACTKKAKENTFFDRFQKRLKKTIKIQLNLLLPEGHDD